MTILDRFNQRKFIDFYEIKGFSDNDLEKCLFIAQKIYQNI